MSTYDATTGAKVGSVATGADFISAVAYSPDGKLVGAVAMDGSAIVIDLEMSTVRAKIAAHLLPCRSVAFSHDGLCLYTGGDDRRINVFDISSGTSGAPLVCSLSGHLHWVTSVAAPADKFIVASGSADKTVRVWDVRKRECLHTYETGLDKIWSVAWSPSGTRLASVSEAGVLGVHSVSNLL